MWCYYLLLSLFVFTNVSYLIHYFCVAHVADVLPAQVANDFGSRICKINNDSEPFYWKYTDENIFNITNRGDWIIGVNKINGRKLFTTQLLLDATDAVNFFMKGSKTDNYGNFLINNDCFVVSKISTNTWVVTTYLFYLVAKFLILFVFNWVTSMCCRQYATI